MNSVLNLQTLAVEDDTAPMEWSTISNHCGSDRELDQI
ncbi:class III lanthipeptide [Microbulbifer sp. EKSA005]